MVILTVILAVVAANGIYFGLLWHADDIRELPWDPDAGLSARWQVAALVALDVLVLALALR